jgi:AcrR family transcriptional regulator
MELFKLEAARQDRRNKRTEKAIKNAFISIMAEKEISNITIKEISDGADINRKTFYAHYVDVYAVLDDIENDLVKKLDDLINNYDILKNRYNPYPLFKELTTELNKNFDFYKHLIQSSSYSKLLMKIKGIIKEKIINIIVDEVKINKNILSYVIEFITAGTISVYEEWFNSDKQLSLEEVSQTASILAFDGVNALIDRKMHKV